MAPNVIADFDDPLYTTNEAAAHLGVSSQHLINARSGNGRGPRPTKIASHRGVLYRASDCLVYELDLFLAKMSKNRNAAA
ncbi:hypothetical protein [Mesorhizobium sp. B2-4-1]|uniref:hypothetical protein n=1 Tax=Mesorhizobium sp. B2-4-1 TaxID=2589948 RepID=UPI001125EE34|nr:hypothetical protein [Mesorhizobium sp. B2-4-1]TPL64670.1 hypothetical protein FJ949_15465 [Mesorhizobium sp. B2-4-1]